MHVTKANRMLCKSCYSFINYNPECRACKRSILDGNDVTALCQGCYDAQAKFTTTCRSCEDKFVTRDLDVVECETCSDYSDKCRNCDAIFDKVTDSMTLCNKCNTITANACMVCYSKAKHGDTYCRTCDDKIQNGICTSCDRNILRTESYNIYGECSACTAARKIPANKYPAPLCHECDIRQSDGSDLLCRICRNLGVRKSTRYI